MRDHGKLLLPQFVLLLFEVFLIHLEGTLLSGRDQEQSCRLLQEFEVHPDRNNDNHAGNLRAGYLHLIPTILVKNCARSNEIPSVGRKIHNALAGRNKGPPIGRLATHTAISGAEHEVCVSTQGLANAFVFQWRLMSNI